MNTNILLTALMLAGLVWSDRFQGDDTTSKNVPMTTLTLLAQGNNQVEPKPAPPFTLQDLEGNEVSLEDYRGKVVVLDFWATWCAPCIKSFPAMQMVIDRYKEDPDVAFFFINTWEQREDPAEFVRQFMEKRGFDFSVLIDKKDPVSKRNPVVESYGVSGIPATFVIDSNGNIKYKLSGFQGGDDLAKVQELSKLIESSRN